MSQNFDLRSSAPQQSQQQPQQQQHPSLTEEQQQQLAQQQQQQQQPLRQWIEQQPTNRFVPPRILEYGPPVGLDSDTLRIVLGLVDMDIIPMLRIALGSCVLPTRPQVINPTTIYVQLTAAVPNWQMTRAVDRTRVPVYVVICEQQQQEVIDNWFIGYFTYDYARKRSSAEYGSTMTSTTGPKRTRRAESLSSLQTDPTTAAYMVPAYQGYPTSAGGPGPGVTGGSSGSSSYYGLPPSPSPYMTHYPATSHTTGPSAPTRSSRGYYEGQPTISPTQMMGYSYRDQPMPPSSVPGSESAPLGYPSIPSQQQQQQHPELSDEEAAAAAAAMSQMGHHPQSGGVLTHATTDPSSAAAAAAAGLQPYMMQQLTPPSMQPQPPPPHHEPPPPHHHQHHPPSISTTMEPIAPAPLAPSGTTPSTSPTTVTSTAGGGGGGSTGSITGSSSTTGQPPLYDPYAHILNKANLHVEGNLEDMLDNWTPEEWQHQRRLVQFWRRQEGNEVICSFAPIAQSERPQQQHMIVVSCIYWREQNDYFITSVDCIYLLESLIGVRFTVEEKNRIRRNLEGFRPLTVSKLRQDSAEFFKLIMAFPNPKPRNIEKDVKVFPWRSLAMALKKIISKYTASYSSTASVNLEALGTPFPGSSDPGEGSSSGGGGVGQPPPSQEQEL
ncbi:hypothetical protein BDA99DRAFT_519943 [Phascolomyces articulosus]|uniref:DUF7082 domain-containing protein n=1 Tax=Phascolomyces articulosus TaxID=60185 RepID=A0AAD5K6T4_9FUNG|nr:hypothetical protein BDA99DRAFT_519943 [Phascolomyces articulosus]